MSRRLLRLLASVYAQMRYGLAYEISPLLSQSLNDADRIAERQRLLAAGLYG
jgi:hypothetical protein